MALTSTSWRAWLPWLWCLGLVVVLLGPALAPGYVLTYDMVWVPHLTLRPDFWGASSAVPRAVPSDALVAVLDNVLPAMVWQKAVLVGALMAAGLGARRLVLDQVENPGSVLPMIALTVAVWNPFVVERLWMGHWTVLLAYGALPWIARAGLAARHRDGVGRWPWWALLLGSLSHSAGLLSAATLLVTTLAQPRQWRHNLAALGVVLAVNAPWAVAGWVHRADAVSSVGTEVFAAAGTDALPAPLAWLTLGGVWNNSVVPGSLNGVSGWLALGLVLGLAALGAGPWWRATPRSTALRLLLLWALGYTIALLTWALPDLTAALARVPGGGLIRDGSRMLALCLPLLVLLVAHGARVVLARVAEPALRVWVAVLLVLAPLALLPDAAWGGSRLAAVDYPASHARARAVVDPSRGDALVLPFSSFRAPPFNGGRVVLDPMGRMLRAVTLTSDVLVVNEYEIPGGDPRVGPAERALALGSPTERAAALRALGIGWVVIDPTTGDRAMAEVPEIEGSTVLDLPEVRVLELSGAVARTDQRSRADRALLGVGWGLWGAAWLTGLVLTAGAVRRRVRPATRR